MAVRARWMGWVVLALVAACGGGAGDGGVQDGSARLARAVAPGCSYDHVYVTVEKVVIGQGSASKEVVLASPRRIDLMGLKGGVLTALGIAPLPVGHYSGVRLILTDNGAGATASPANAVLPTGGTAMPLTTPSAQQSGLKLQADFDVAHGQSVDLLLNFDPCQSVTRAGNSGRDLLSPVLAAQPIDVSLIAKGEFRVNTTTAGAQDQAVVTSMNDGGYMVTWLSDSQYGSGRDVYAQRFDATGAPMGGELELGRALLDPLVAAWPDGGFVVTWNGGSGLRDIEVQRYSADGTPVGSTLRVNTTTGYTQLYPFVAALADGGFAVGWTLMDANGLAIAVRRFDASGAPMGNEVQVFRVSFAGALKGRIFAMPDGGFMVVWHAREAAWQFREMAIYVQRFDAVGNPIGTPTKIASSTASPVSDPTVFGYSMPVAAALDNGGNYLVTWAQGDLDGSGWNVYAQRLESTGTLVGSPARVNTTTTGDQAQSAIAALGDGRYLVAWASDGQDGSGYGIYTQLFDAGGSRIGGERLINSTTAASQQQPSVTILRSGASVITWASENQDGSGYGIYAQQFDAQGFPR